MTGNLSHQEEDQPTTSWDHRHHCPLQDLRSSPLSQHDHTDDPGFPPRQCQHHPVRADSGNVGSNETDLPCPRAKLQIGPPAALDYPHQLPEDKLSLSRGTQTTIKGLTFHDFARLEVETQKLRGFSSQSP